MLAEHHKTASNQQDMIKTYAYAGMHMFSNPAQKSPSSGEAICLKSHLCRRQVDSDIIEQVQKKTGSPLHCAPLILRLKHVSLLLLSVYMWSGEGLSDKNYTIICQINAFQDLLGLPILAAGDFNNTTEQLLDAGWLDYPKLSP